MDWQIVSSCLSIFSISGRNWISNFKSNNPIAQGHSGEDHGHMSSEFSDQGNCYPCYFPKSHNISLSDQALGWVSVVGPEHSNNKVATIDYKAPKYPTLIRYYSY